MLLYTTLFDANVSWNMILMSGKQLFRRKSRKRVKEKFRRSKTSKKDNSALKNKKKNWLEQSSPKNGNHFHQILKYCWLEMRKEMQKMMLLNFKLTLIPASFQWDPHYQSEKKNATKPKKQDMSESAASSQSGVIHKASFNPKSYTQAKSYTRAINKASKSPKIQKNMNNKNSSSQTKDHLYQENLEELPSDL